MGGAASGGLGSVANAMGTFSSPGTYTGGAGQLANTLNMKGTAGPMIGGMFGQNGGINGSGFGGPQMANIQQAVNPGQLAQSNQGVQNALGSQQQLLLALQGQGGLNNQNAVFNQGQALANQLQGANPVAAQQALMGQYANIAAGNGPSPGQAMLNQATGQNVANQAALMAGQRGAGSNVGLMARQAAQQGAATQQQAVGQGAQMQAQNQLAAMQNMAGISGAQLGALQGQQQALAGQAAGQVANQMGATNALSQAQQANQQAQLGALGQQNQAQVSAQGNVNTANAGLANTTMQGQQGIVGGLLNAGGAGIGAMAAEGGEVQKPKKMADGGQPNVAATPANIAPPAAPTVAAPMPTQPQGPQSSWGKFLQGSATSNPFSDEGGNNSGAQSLNKGMTSVGTGIAKAIKGKPGQADTGNDSAVSDDNGAGGGGGGPHMNAATPGYAGGGLSSKGGHVAAKKPAQKAVKSGDNYDNDKIPALLSEGEIVLPRSVTKSADPVNAAAKFVQALMAKKGKRA